MLTIHLAVAYGLVHSESLVLSTVSAILTSRSIRIMTIEDHSRVEYRVSTNMSYARHPYSRPRNLLGYLFNLCASFAAHVELPVRRNSSDELVKSSTLQYWRSVLHPLVCRMRSLIAHRMGGHGYSALDIEHCTSSKVDATPPWPLRTSLCHIYFSPLSALQRTVGLVS